MKNKLFKGLVLSSMAMGLAVNQGRANPLGGSVVAGGATISGEGTALTTIHQTTDRAIINWQDFSIGLGEITRFIQPGTDSAVLNRVLSGSPSQLLGTLQANGQVYLINPNGILVGASGQINTASFIASTLDVSNGSFLSGGDMQFLGSSTAGVENLGSINALGGDIFLFGHTVKNSGTLQADGTVGLAAGMSIELRQAGNERIGVLLGNSAAPAATGVDNQGLVQATSVEINAAGGNIYAVAINNGGVVRAQPTLAMEGGKLVLKADGGAVVNSGTLDASNPNGKGGTVEVLGGKVGLATTSVIDASGKTGGGAVLIGGDYQGKNAAIPNAKTTFVSAGAVIKADATTVGDGGKIIVWSDELTSYFGSISAKGGAQGGNGGFAEVSGKQNLIFKGLVDLSAANGAAGSLLLDPSAIEIVAADPADGSYTTDLAQVDQAGDPNVGAGKTSIDVASINGASGTVTLAASVSITQNSGATISTAADLVFTAPLITLNDSVTAASLTLNGSLNTLAGSGVTTTGVQVYNGSTSLSASQVLNANSSTIAFGGSIIGNNWDIDATANGGFTFSGDVIQVSTLTISSTALTTFSAKVTDVGTLSKNGSGGTIFDDEVVAGTMTIAGPATLNNGNVTTTGGQTYDGLVTLGANAVLTGVGINLNAGVTGAGFDLTLNDSTTTVLDGTFSGIKNLTTDVAGATTINASISTSGSQIYNDPVTVGADATLTTSPASAVTFGDTLTLGANNLTIASSSSATFTGAVTATTGDLDVTATTSISLAGGITSGGDVRLNTGGTVTQGAAIVAVGLQLNGAATYTLTDAGNDVDTLAANTGGAISFRDADGLTIGSVTVGSSTVAGITTSDDNVTIQTGAALVIDDDISIGAGNLTLNVVGGATQNAGDTVTAAGLELLGSGAIVLADAGNNVATLAANTTDTISYRDTDGLTVGTVNTVGITTTDDNVTIQTGGSLTIDDDISIGAGNLTLNVAGATQNAGDTIAAAGLEILGSGAVTLTDSGNAVTTIAVNTTGSVSYRDTDGLTVGTVNTVGITTTGGNVSLQTGAALVIDDDISIGTGNLTLNVVGGATQNAGDTITAAGLELLGSGAIVLADAGNNVATLAANTTDTISYRDTDGLTVGTVNTVGITTTDDNVTIQTGGSLTIDDDISIGAGNLTLNVAGATQNAGDTIAAAGLEILGSGAVTLTDSGNAVTTIAVNTTGSVSYRDTDGLTVGTVNTVGITTTGGNVSLQTGGSLTIDDDISIGAGNLTLNVAGATQNAGDTIAAAGLEILGSGTVTLTDSGNAVTTIAVNTTGSVSYRDTDGLTVGTVNTVGITTTGGNVSLQTGAALVIDDDISIGAGNLTLNVVGGATQNAGDTITAAGLELLGSGAIVLADAGNNVATLAANTTDTISYRDTDGLTVGTVNTVGITTTDDNVTIQTGGSLTIDDDISIGAGNLTLNVAGATQNAGDTIAAAGLEILGSGAVTLTDSGNAVTTIAVNTTGSVSYRDTDGLTVGTVNTVGITTTGGNVSLQTGAALVIDDDISIGTGNLTLNVVGGATQNAGDTITAAGLELLGSGAIVLADAGNNVATLAANTTDTISYRDTDGLTVGTVNTVGITTTDDNVTIQTGGALAIEQVLSIGTGALSVTVGGDATQTAAGVITAGSATFTVDSSTDTADSISVLLATADNNVAGTVTFAEQANDEILDVAWRNVSGTAQWPNLPNVTTINDLTVQLTAVAINIDDPDVTVITLKNVGGDLGDLVILAGGAITQTDDLVIPGTTTLTAPSNADITLNNAGNDFTGIVNLQSGEDITLRDANNITVNAGVATYSSLIINATGIFLDDSDAGTSTAVTITTVNGQSYNGNVVLNQDTVMNSTSSGTISFAGTINSDAVGTPRSLEVNTAGLTQFNGANVGDVAPLSSLTTDSVASGILGGSTELTGTFVTTVSQLHRDAVVLKSDVVIDTSAATFDSTVNGDGANNGEFGLTINDTAGTGSATSATFNGAVGTTANSALGFLTVNAGTINLNGGAVTTSSAFGASGDQVYNGAVLIDTTGNTTTLLGVDITFQSTVRSLTDGEEALIVSGTGTTTFNGAVGDNSQRLLTLTANNGGSTVVNGGSVTSTSTQTYNDAVTIGSGAGDTTTFTSGSTGATLGVHFASTLDGDTANDADANVIINTQGITRFDDIVGNTVGNASITSLTTDAGGETHINSTQNFTVTPIPGTVNLNTPNVWTLNNQTYGDDVKLSVDLGGGDVLVRAESVGANITFSQRIDGSVDYMQGLKIHSDTSNVNQSLVGILVPLEFFDASTGPNVAFQNITLTDNTEIVAGNVVFGTVTAGAFELTVTANDITFAAGPNSVTGTSDLTLRPIDPTSTIGIGGGAGTFNLDDADIAALADGFRSITIGRFDGSGLVTVGTLDVTDPLRIQSPFGSIRVEGLINSTATVAEGLAAGPRFATDIDAAGVRQNSETIAGARTVNAFGLTGGASTTTGGGVVLFGAGATTTMLANIQTTGTAIFINDSVVLNTSVSLITSDGGITAGNDITITGVINADNAVNTRGLTFDAGTGGNIDLQSAIGNNQTLTSVTVNQANNVDFDNTVAVSGAITITAANDVIFRNTVNAGSVIQSAGSGTTTFIENVTTTGAAGVNITSAGITLDGLTIDSTTGNGTIRFNGPVTLSTADVTLSAAGGNITFENTLNGGFNLLLNSTAFTTFNGLVGTGTALTSVTTDAGGTTVINGAGVTTTADQLYNDNVTLGVAAVTLNGVNVTFNGTLDGPAALQVNASGVTTFGDAAGDSVGAGTALLSLTTDAAGSTTVNAAIVTTSGQQIYNDAVTFNTDINFTGSTVTFNQALAGAANNLTVTGNAVFGDAAADSVNTGAILVTGNTTVNAATVNTGAESQTYNGDVTLNTDVNFTGSTVQYDEDILGTPNNLTITGSAIFGNASNDAVNTGAILVTGATLVNSGTVTTTGETQTYTGNVGLGNSVNFTGTTVNFLEDVIGGANNLTVTGDATFGDGADDIIGANQITVTGATSITAGAVNSTTSQIYDGAITLAGSTVLTAGTDITFNSTINGTFNMTVSAGGVTRFNGTVGNTADLATLIVDGGGTAIINTPQIDAAAVQFDDAVILAADTTVTGTSSIRFNSTITGANFDLTTVSGGAFTQFNGDVTGVDVLNTTGLATFINTALISGNVLNFDDAIGIDAANVQLVGQTSVDFASTIGSSGLGGAEAGNNLTINSPVVGFHGVVSGNGALADLLGTLTVDGTTAGAGTTTIDIAAAGANGNHIAANIINFNQGVVVDQSAAVLGVTSVSFNSIVNSAASEANNLTVNSPVTLFAGVVGGAVNGALGTLSTDAAGTTTIDTTAITAAVVDFNDAIVLNQSVLVTGTTSVDFLSTINSQAAEANSLTVNSPVTGFHGIIGALVPLGTLSTDAAGTTTLDTTAITAAVVDFNDAVLVDQNLTINGTTSIDFAGTLDSQAGENNDLLLNSPITAFHGVVGGTRPLGTLNTDAAGTTTLDTTSITVAVADFNDAVVVDQNLTINGTTSIDFASSLNSQVLENNDLTLNSPTTGFHGIVGAASPFGTLSTDAVGTTTIDTTAVTAADVDFNDAILLTQDVVINGTATIDFASTVNSSGGARDLTLNSPTTAFHGVVGGNAALDVLSTDAAGTTTIDTTAITAAVVDFNDAILLTQDVVITGTTSIDFASTVNSSGGARDLTLNSPVTGFHGVVGGSAVLDVLSTDAAGTTTIDTTAINAATIDFNDAIIIDVGTVLTGTTSVDFAQTVDSQVGEANDLTINSPTTGFHGIVGGIAPLNTLMTDAAGMTTIDTTAITADVVDFNDAILLSQDVVINGTTSVDFASTVNSSGAARDLTVNSPTTAFHGIVGGVTPLDVLTTDAAGTTTIDTTAITGATLDFNDAVTLSQNVVLTGTTTVDFATTLNSDLIATPRTLLVVSPLTIFGGSVGGAVPLASLTTDASGGQNLTRINGGLVITTGDQLYNDTVRLGADTTLVGNDITFASLLDSSEGALRSLTVNSTGGGITTFSGAVGTLDRLAHLETNGDGRTDIAGGLINLNGASALFNDPVLLLADLTINEAGVGSVTFNNTLNGAFNLVVNSDGLGATIFNGVVGGVTPLASITTDADGTTQINGGIVNTSGFQLYNDPVTIGANTVLTSTGVGAAGNITFVTTLDGPFTLLVNTAGTTTFGGPVGSITPLNSVTTDAPGATAINGGSVLTFGIQTYNDPVTLGANTIITSTGAAALGNVTFNSTLDSAVGPFSLIVNTAGNTDFNGAVGGVGALLSLTTDAPGTVSIDGGAVTTTTFQLYNDVATIGANTVLASTGAGNITFMQTLDGAFTLNVNTAGITIFNGVVGGITPLVSVVTDAPGATQVNGTAVTTTGIQTYNDPVTVGANTLFTSTGVGAVGNITFNSTLDDNAVAGLADVTINTAGATTFNGAVGGIAPLTSLTTDAAGNVAINGGLVTTVNNQTYNDVATLGADTVLNSLAAGNITFAQTLDDDLTIPANTSNLIVNTSGVTTFGGVVGGISPLTSITTDPAVGVVGAGDITAINGGLVITTGFQTYNDNVTVNQDTTLTSNITGNITIGQPNPPVPWGNTTLRGTVPGVDMIINAFGGNVQINAAVSAVNTFNGFATGTYIAANPANTGIILYYSTPNSPYVYIYTIPPSSFNLDNKIYSLQEIFGRDVPNLFKYPGDAKEVTSDISVLLSTNRVEKLIGSLPTDKIVTSYDLATLEEENRKKR